MSIQNAFSKWLNILDHNRVVLETDTLATYEANTSGISRKIYGVLKPQTVEEIQKIVLIANEEKVSLSPISTGHNWGYGTALPSQNDSVILDLSSMNTITDFDPKLGTVTVQPGVTQKILYDYLEKHNYDFIVPTTGAGPKGSILGNALERGFGPTQSPDHFSAITSISAVLADGTLYRSPLDEYGCSRVDKLYRYSVGPYLDAIFSQSNFGIVTEATFALARKPEVTTLFFCELSSHDQLKHVVEELPALLQKLGTMTSGIKFVNKHQLAAMNTSDQTTDNTSDHFPEWLVTGNISGDRRMVAAAKKVMRSHLKDVTRGIFFLNAGFFNKHINKLLVLPMPKGIKKTISNFSITLDVFLGKPSTAALPLAYLGSGVFPKNRDDLDPGKDGCGIIWFAPLIPIDGDAIVSHVTMIENIFSKYSFPHLLTFTSLNERCFDSPIAIVFDKNDETSVRDAKSCYNELWNASLEHGHVPYRIPVDEQHRITHSGTPFWDIVQMIKDALDPNAVISPGRYSKK